MDTCGVRVSRTPYVFILSPDYELVKIVICLLSPIDGPWTFSAVLSVEVVRQKPRFTLIVKQRW